MTSFKRRLPAGQVAVRSGTRTCPTSLSTILTSSGIPSLDDILGGGIPLSCSLAVLAPDSQSAYGELVQKYFIAQGLASGHKVCIVHEDGLSFAKECMWMPVSNTNDTTTISDEDDTVENGEKIKIAWRYERMKRFETTVKNPPVDRFCDTFDLTCRIPTSVIDEAYDAKQVVPLNLAIDNDLASSMDELVRRIKDVLGAIPSTEVVRLCIMALGSPEWGECYPTDILRFLCALRRLLHRYPHACACVTVDPHLCTEAWGGSGWVEKVGWVTDGAISMTGFGANPVLTALFPSQHGLVQIHKLPAPHSILATSDKYSTLRGLSTSAGANIGAGENNLAFRCMRKRLVFETMHLDLEGGVTERRTTPSSTRTGVLDTRLVPTLARVTVELESDGQSTATAQQAKDPKKKEKKRVAFRSDKPDLYDF